MSLIHRLWEKPSLLTANLFYRVASCCLSVLQLLWNCLLCCEVWNMISERTNMWQGRFSNCDGICGADITVLSPSEVQKIFCNNICELVRFMVWILSPEQCQDYWIFNDIRVTWPPDWVAVCGRSAVGMLSSVLPDTLGFFQTSLSRSLPLSLSLCSAARPTAITVWIKILLNTLLPLQSGQEVWLQLMMALHGRRGRNRRRVYKISEDLEQFHNLKNRPEKLEPNNLLWIANYQPLIII